MLMILSLPLMLWMVNVYCHRFFVHLRIYCFSKHPEELVSELKSVQSELMSKIENLDHSAQSIVEALPPLLEMEVTVILPL